jgi:uncharacterized protein YxjI
VTRSRPQEATSHVTRVPAVKNGERGTTAPLMCHYRGMSRYILTRNLWSRGGAYIVRDAESGGEFLRIHRMPLGVGDKLSVEEPGGNEVAFIRQGLHLGVEGLCYEISQAGRLAARVDLTPRLRQHLLIETPDPGTYEAAGDIPGMDYQISRDGRQVASISAGVPADAESYAVDVAEGQDPLFILVLAITIETVHEQNG